MNSPQLSKGTRRRRSGCALIAFAGFAGVPIGVLGAVVLLIAMDSPEPVERIPFDSVRWRDAERSTETDANIHTKRQGMAHDLAENVLRSGATRDEVRAMLGSPNRWPIFDGSSWFGREDEAWWLGTSDAWLSSADDWLVLDFDDRDRLVKASIVNCCDADD